MRQTGTLAGGHRVPRTAALARLSQMVGRRVGIPGLWLLLPGDQQALLDGKPVPLIGSGQRVRIPVSWLNAGNHSSPGREASGK
ncbi:MAG: hypothetical protein ACKO38_15085 [Planctomycetota bacterium]